MSLGLGAFLIPSFVWRTIPAFDDAPAGVPRPGSVAWTPTALDSEHDYDPFWKRAVELNAPLAAHMSGAGPDRPHLADELRVLGRASSRPPARRWPSRCSSVACSTGSRSCASGSWKVASAIGVRLFGDLVGRFEKRGPGGPAQPRPAQPRHRGARAARRRRTSRASSALPEDRLVPFLGVEDGRDQRLRAERRRRSRGHPRPVLPQLLLGLRGRRSARRGAFDPRVNPLGATVPAFVGSDIGHWDVPNFDHPLQRGLRADRARPAHRRSSSSEFTLTNAVRFYAGTVPTSSPAPSVEDPRAVIEGGTTVTVMEESGRGRPGAAIAGKVAIVTGGGQVDGPGVGTGKATAILLARHGADVVLVDREPERAEVTRTEIDGGRRAGDRRRGRRDRGADCDRMTQAALDEFGRLDVLVNNVGVSRPGSVVDTDRADVGRPCSTVNLKSVYLVSRPAIPAMAEHRWWLDREHLLHRRAALHRVRRVLGGQGRDDLAQPGDGRAARAPGHPGQRGGARRDPDAAQPRALRTARHRPRRGEPPVRVGAPPRWRHPWHRVGHRLRHALSSRATSRVGSPVRCSRPTARQPSPSRPSHSPVCGRGSSWS